MKLKCLFLILVLLFGIFILTGCKGKVYDLPDNPIVFEFGEFNTDNGDGYMAVEHNGKAYIMYGAIKSRGLLSDISYAFGECLGYVGDDEADRIYALADESTDEWLIEYYVDGIMENPVVLREISAKGNNNIPNCVESFEYDYWK